MTVKEAQATQLDDLCPFNQEAEYWRIHTAISQSIGTIIDESVASAWQAADGRATLLVTPSAKKAGYTQVTYFGRSGPVSDAQVEAGDTATIVSRIMEYSATLKEAIT